MEILNSLKKVKNFRKMVKAQNLTLGVIPTMGFLHEGHLTLMRKAKAECDKTIATIFVNPLQFGQGEDFDRYPKALERDCKLLEEIGVDAVFIPDSREMYPEGFQTAVEVTEVSQHLCGASRPGHFKGVTTVVAKLFNLTGAHKAYFGLKDAQQLQVIKTMVRDLNFDIEVIPVPIVREEDGLAMSSRNSYLSSEERRAALVLNQSLQKARELMAQGETDALIIKEEIKKMINKEPLAKVDYIKIVDFDNMEQNQKIKENTLIALAVWVGATRLIDNLLVGG